MSVDPRITRVETFEARHLVRIFAGFAAAKANCESVKRSLRYEHFSLRYEQFCQKITIFSHFSLDKPVLQTLFTCMIAMMMMMKII